MTRKELIENIRQTEISVKATEIAIEELQDRKLALLKHYSDLVKAFYETKPTRADEIRELDDDKLAEFLCKHFDVHKICGLSEDGLMCSIPDCYNRVKAWLKDESKVKGWEYLAEKDKK